MKLESGKCSYYVNVKSKQNQVITLAQFVNAIRQGRWKKDVEDYRRCKAEKRIKEAEAIKARMPGGARPECVREDTPRRMSASSVAT